MKELSNLRARGFMKELSNLRVRGFMKELSNLRARGFMKELSNLRVRGFMKELSNRPNMSNSERSFFKLLSSCNHFCRVQDKTQSNIIYTVYNI